MRSLFKSYFAFLITFLSSILLVSCGTSAPVNDFFGIMMNPLDEENFKIFSYDEFRGVRYQSSAKMDTEISAWAEIGVDNIIFKIVNDSPRPIPLNYFTDQFIIITNENKYIVDKGPRAEYFFGSKISPGSSADISFKIPSDFAQDFVKRGGAMLKKDIMGDLSKNWSNRQILKDNIVYLIIRLSDISIVLKQVPEN